MNKRLIGFLAISGVMTSGVAFSTAFAAATPSIGLIDMQEALQTVKDGKDARAKLEKEFNDRKAELKKEESDIKKLGEEFRKKSLVLSEKAKGEKQAELQQKIMALQEKTGRSQMELQQREQELTGPIIEKLRGIVEKIAKDKGYTIVLQRAGNAVIYSQAQDDITNEVIAAYNKK